MINRVVPAAERAGAARVPDGPNPSLDQFLELEALTQSGVHQTLDFNGGVSAFREKRDAKFTGR